MVKWLVMLIFVMVYMVKIHLGVDIADVNGSIDVKGTFKYG